MIDLKKLQAKFDDLFASETEESFNNWLTEKMHNEAIALLGKGEIQSFKTSTLAIQDSVINQPFNIITGDAHSTVVLDSQYAFAA